MNELRKGYSECKMKYDAWGGDKQVLGRKEREPGEVINQDKNEK